MDIVDTCAAECEMAHELLVRARKVERGVHPVFQSIPTPCTSLLPRRTQNPKLCQ